MNASSQAPEVTKLKVAAAMMADTDTQAMSAVLAELVRLRAMVPAELERKPVADAGLELAVADLVSKADADLKSESAKEKPTKNLSGFLGFIPELTATQKVIWKAAKDTLENRYSAWHRAKLSLRKAAFNRAASKPGSVIGSSLKQRKDGTYSLVRLSVRLKAMAKPAKADNKPAQIAAKPAVAGNAGEPAKVS